jgi:hypothetical protein
MSFAAKTVSLAQAADQRAAILEAVSEALKDFNVIYGADVLTATYIEPETTAGGIILPGARINESIYQGKVGLVLALGNEAFKYRDGYSFFSKYENETDEEYLRRTAALTPKPGDWVFYRTSSTWKCTINKVACQFIRDVEIKGRITNPNAII